MFEAEEYRIAGEIALKPPESDIAKAQAYLERGLSVARAQRTKSLELRAVTTMARLRVVRAGGERPTNCLLRFTGGSPRGSTCAI